MKFGQYTLDTFIAHGGMGQVYRATHTRRGTAVAIKMLLQKHSKEDASANFIKEAQTLATLHHPNIVSIIDLGRVEPPTLADTRALQDRGVAAGTPFMVMELAEGALSEHKPASLSQALPILLQILEGLAHLHARGYVHRDLKPSNVLRFPNGRHKLSDFGLAQIYDETSEHLIEMPVGSVMFMAPEQLRGQWRDFGPWTDLYAFGCLMCWLLTGDTPFKGESWEQVAAAHFMASPPFIKGGGRAEPGLQRLLSGLLTKSTQRRFRHAMDVHRALTSLTPLVDDTGACSLDRQTWEEGETVEAPDCLGWTLREATHTPTDLTLSAAVKKPAAQVGLADTLRESRELLAPSPQTEEIAALPRPLNHHTAPMVGLGILALRRSPLIGRSHEQRRLWQIFQKSRRRQGPSVVILSGASGLGKTRLATWLCEEADQLGLAETFKVFHPSPGQYDNALRQMLLRKLKCAGMDNPQAIARLRAVFQIHHESDPVAADRSIAFLYPELVSSKKSSAARHVLLMKTCLTIAGERLPLIMIDDAHWGPDALTMTQLWIERGEPGFIVLTVRDDLAANTAASIKLDRLAASPCATKLDLSPLKPKAHRELINRTLAHMPDRERERVAVKTAESPLFAVELVTDWLTRDVLWENDEGEWLPRGDASHIPDSIHTLWSLRLESLLTAMAPLHVADQAQVATLLETVACLGHEIDEALWGALCETLRLQQPQRLLNLLSAMRLIHQENDHWRLVHSVLTDTLKRRAAEQGRLGSCHRRCARLLKEVPLADGGLRAGQAALHLMWGGALTEALEALLEAAQMRANAWRIDPSIELLDAVEQCADALALPPAHRARALACCIRADVAAFFFTGDMSIAQRAVEVARQCGEAPIITLSLLYLGSAQRFAGHYEEATSNLTAASQQFEVQDNHTLASRAQLELSMITLRQGNLEEAQQHTERAVTMARRCGNPRSIGRSLLGRGNLLELQGRRDEARVLLNEAITIFNRVGMLFSVAAALNTLGEIERKEGRLDKARELYREALSMMSSTGSMEGIIPQMNLCLMEIQSPAPAPETVEALEDLIEQSLHLNRRYAAQSIRHMQMALAAKLGDWASFDTYFEEVARLHKDFQNASADHLELLALTLAQTQKAGDSSRTARLEDHINRLIEVRTQM